MLFYCTALLDSKGNMWDQPHLIVQSNAFPVLEVAAICARCSWTFSRSHGENLEDKGGNTLTQNMSTNTKCSTSSHMSDSNFNKANNRTAATIVHSWDNADRTITQVIKYFTFIQLVDSKNYSHSFIQHLLTLWLHNYGQNYNYFSQYIKITIIHHVMASVTLKIST